MSEVRRYRSRGMRIRRNGAALAILFSVAAFIFLCWWHRSGSDPVSLQNLNDYNEQSRHAIPADERIERIVFLDQGWTPGESAEFYSRSQGSRLMPYDWFLALEVADGDGLFRSPDNMNRLGYLSQKPSDWCPDGLPVGFVRDIDRERGDWLGFTCAACHTSEIHFGTTAFRIDGGPALADFQTFMAELKKSLAMTQERPEKFERFAERLNADNRGLRMRLNSTIERVKEYESLNAAPHRYGHGRLDAFGHILNQVIVRDLGNPASEGKPPDAPVSYPCLWDTPHHDFVQWNAIARNSVLGSDRLGGLVRNVGEVVGVFGEVHVSPPRTASTFTGYRSSIRVPDLLRLEELVRKLHSPQWPESFPPIDKEKAEAGRALFDEHCVRCHHHINRTDPNRTVRAVKTPIRTIGTDPKMAQNVANRVAKTGRVEGRREYFATGDRFGATAKGDALIVHTVVGVVLNSPWRQYREADFSDVRDRGPNDSTLVYKARPLNGVWATAPYLHNGSVPNLYELLKPAHERVSDFHVGSRVFDPVNVGYVINPTPTSFRFRTHDNEGRRIPGNSNAGHEYGTNLSVEQRRQLIEYLKTQ